MLKIRLSALALAGLSLAIVHSSNAATFQEDFSTDPALRGWHAVGQTNLFSWNSTNQNLEVTWDSSQSNSFFCRPLGTILAATDDFGLDFDLQLKDVTVGPDPAKPYTFELALGLVNLQEATGTNFLRAVARHAPDLVEFDYFPDDSGSPSVDATLSDTNGTMHFYYVNLPLTAGETYHVSMSYTADNNELQTLITWKGEPYTTLTNRYFQTGFGDFRVDHLAVCSYNDAGQDPQYSGSILAHGLVDNITLTLPPPPVANVQCAFSNGAWQVQFSSQTNWLYTLERTEDFQSWTAASAAAIGNGTSLVLQDTNGPAAKAFYRVRANRP